MAQEQVASLVFVNHRCSNRFFARNHGARQRRDPGHRRDRQGNKLVADNALENGISPRPKIAGDISGILPVSE